MEWEVEQLLASRVHYGKLQYQVGTGYRDNLHDGQPIPNGILQPISKIRRRRRSSSMTKMASQHILATAPSQDAILNSLLEGIRAYNARIPRLYVGTDSFDLDAEMPLLLNLPSAPLACREPLAEFEGAPDGYIAVQRCATAKGVPGSALLAAFLEARRQLAETGLDTRAPEGLRALLDELRANGTRVLLVTNAPPHGLDRMLVHLGLDGAFDDVIADAGKPRGLAAILDGLGHPVTKDTVLSVGDIYLNDLSVPLERGASTALIDPFDRVEGDPDMRVRAFEDLIPFIRSWGALPA